MSKDNIPDFAKREGLVTAIAQDFKTGEVLMVAFMNREAFEKTVELGEAVYWSTSRNRLWRKGEESGNVQRVKKIYVDCDGDCILLKVEQFGGAACHTGRRSCFFREKDGDIWRDIGIKVFDPEKVYKKTL